MKNAFGGLISRLDTTKQESQSLGICQWKLLKLKCKEEEKRNRVFKQCGKIKKGAMFV